MFSPGKSACWTCLAERMQRNREVKAFLDRKQARRVAASPLARDLFGQRPSSLPPSRSRKRSRPTFAPTCAINHQPRPAGLDHREALRGGPSAMSGLRPQGAARPRRAPAPVELGAGGKLVMTSGGYRSVSPRATVARFRKHVSPLTGVVSRLERIDADLPMNTNYLATHNFSARPENGRRAQGGTERRQLRQGQHCRAGRSQRADGGDRALFRNFPGRRNQGEAAVHGFPAGRRHSSRTTCCCTAMRNSGGVQAPASGSDEVTPMPAPFDRSAEIEWSPVWSLRDERFKYLPTSLLYFFYRGPGRYQVHADSNGCAAGNTLEEAIVQGFLELVERDAYAIWWYNRSQRAEVDLDQFDDPYIRDLKIQLAETGRRLWLLDITSDLGIPTFVTIAHWMEDGQEFVDFGSGAHFDARIAALRAMTELNQFLSIGLMGAPDRAPGSRNRASTAPRHFGCGTIPI